MIEASPLAEEYKAVCEQRSILPDDRLLSNLQSSKTQLHLSSDEHVTLLLNVFTTLPVSTTPVSLPTHLTIHASSLSASTIGTLATYLTRQTHLTHLCIQGTHLPATGAETLLTALTAAAARDSPLTHLRLSDVGLSTTSACALAPLLTYELGQLTHLDLSNNRANFGGVSALLGALSRRDASAQPLEIDTSGNLVVIERLNALTHGLGAAIAVPAGALLIWRALHSSMPLAGVLAVTIFCLSLVTLLLSSCTYHSLHRRPYLHAVFRRADHCSIFLLIAGSYTPFIYAFALQPPELEGLLTLAAVWAFAAVGIGRSLVGAGSNGSRAFFALATGWVGVFGIRTMWQRVPSGALWGIVCGGLVYSFGIAFYLLGKWHPLFHVVWHLAVIFGGCFHYIAVSKYVVDAVDSQVNY